MGLAKVLVYPSGLPETLPGAHANQGVCLVLSVAIVSSDGGMICV